MAYYHFRQNNSGGDFVVDPTRGLGPHVWIEADSTHEANEIADRIGIYFNGVDADIDCPCCGDRWYPAQDYDREDNPPITENNFYWSNEVYAHLSDGTIKVITEDECFPENEP